MSANNLVSLRIWGGMPGEGINTQGHVLVNHTADGVDLNVVFAEIERLFELWNGERQTVASLVSYFTTVPADAVPQTLTWSRSMRRRSSVCPKALRRRLMCSRSGTHLRTSTKHPGLRGVSCVMQVPNRSGRVTRILSGDNQLVNGLVLRRLFDPTEGVNDYQHRVFGLWNGTDSIAPPPYMGNTFPATTSHYLSSGAATLDSGDVESLVRLMTLKGYGVAVGTQLIILANPAEAEVIQSWRAGEVSDNAQKAKYDFVPSSNAPPFLTSENVHGAIPPPDFHGLKVLGAYGKAWLIETNYVPSGYVALVA